TVVCVYACACMCVCVCMYVCVCVCVCVCVRERNFHVVLKIFYINSVMVRFTQPCDDMPVNSCQNLSLMRNKTTQVCVCVCVCVCVVGGHLWLALGGLEFFSGTRESF